MIGVARAAGGRHGVCEGTSPFGKPIAEFQAVQFQLADGHRYRGGPTDGLQRGTSERRSQPFAQQAAMAKLFSSQVADRITSCLELFGGYGYSKEYPAEKYYRDAEDRDDLRGHRATCSCRTQGHLLIDSKLSRKKRRPSPEHRRGPRTFTIGAHQERVIRSRLLSAGRIVRHAGRGILRPAGGRAGGIRRRNRRARAIDRRSGSGRRRYVLVSAGAAEG